MLFLFFFQAVVMVIESMHEKTDEAMCKLLQALFRSFVITFDQMKNVSITELTFSPTYSVFRSKMLSYKIIFFWTYCFLFDGASIAFY